MAAISVRSLAFECIDAHAKREMSNAHGYDWKVGLAACGSARLAIEQLPAAGSEVAEREQIILALEALMSAGGLAEGEFSTEAASIGSILAEFKDRSSTMANVSASAHAAAPALPPKHAFVLAGGGSLGAVQAGMLAELIGSGVRPDFIVGVSAGALNGSFLAYEPSTSMTARMMDLWSRTRTRDILPVSFASVWGLLSRRGYLADSRGVRALLERELPYKTFGPNQIPLHIVASDQHSGEEVVLSEGNLVDAILASAAIPGVFPPVNIGGRSLVDGAVSAGTPISTAIRMGATRVTILPCGFTCVDAAVPANAIGRAMHAISLLGARQLRTEFEQFSDRAQLCMVPPLCPNSCSCYDYSRGAELVAASRASTRRWLDAGGLDSREFPAEFVTHSH